MANPIFGDPKWIAVAQAPGYSRGRGGRRSGQPWADVRGAGPEGRTCRSCKFVKANRCTKTFYKCGKAPITNGPGTDIRLKDQACILYEEHHDQSHRNKI